MSDPPSPHQGALEGAWLDLEGGWIVRGWACDDRPGVPLDLEIVLPSGAVVPVRADRPRADLAAAGIGAHAFEAALPRHLCTGPRDRLHLRVAGTGTYLPDYRGPVHVSRRYGVIERCDNLKMEGWCVDLSSPQTPPVIEVRDDEDIVAALCCDRPRPDLAGFATRPRAFSIALPERLWDGRTRVLDVRFADGGEHLRGSPFTHRFALGGRTASFATLGRALERARDAVAALEHRIDLEARAGWVDPGVYGHWLARHHHRLAADLGVTATTPRAPWITVLACPADGLGASIIDRAIEAGGEASLFAVTRPDVTLDRPLLDAVATRALTPGRRPDAFVYADEDTAPPDGPRCNPLFKTEPDPYRLLAHPWIGSFFLVGGALLKRIRAAAPAGERIHSYETLLLRCVFGAARRDVVRLRVVLGSRRAPATPAAPPWSHEQWRESVVTEIAARRLPARVEPTAAGPLRLRWELPNPVPEVAIIVPTRNRHDLLRNGLGSLFERTTYPRYRVVIVDNGSDDPLTLDHLSRLAADPRVTVLRDEGPFNFSRLNNRAVAVVDSPLLCLLNNDVEVVSPDWLDEMAGWATRPEIGAVGAKLLYPDGLVQHGGSLVGVWGGADNTHRIFGRDDSGYGLDLVAARRVSAVTAACLVCRRDRWIEIGGMDEDAFPINFNDVDLCLRLGRKGLATIWTPHAILIHHESQSRGWKAAHETAETELQAMRDRWHTDTFDDPYYSPNFSRWHEPFTRLAPEGGWAAPAGRR